MGKALDSCRDSAWLLVQILRHLGLAARFLSGYLVQREDPRVTLPYSDADRAAIPALGHAVDASPVRPIVVRVRLI